MTNPKTTKRRPRRLAPWVESQAKFSGATEVAVFDDFMDWYRANVHGVRNVKPRGVKRESGNGAEKFSMLVNYEDNSASETGHPHLS
jgi:hypothetical protein